MKIRSSHHYCNVDEWTIATVDGRISGRIWEGVQEDEAKPGYLAEDLFLG